MTLQKRWLWLALLAAAMFSIALDLPQFAVGLLVGFSLNEIFSTEEED